MLNKKKEKRNSINYGLEREKRFKWDLPAIMSKEVNKEEEKLL